MCGIIGVINSSVARNASFSICKMFSDGVVANSLRGMDSTGIMQFDKGKMYVYKKSVSGSDFIKLEDAQAHLTDVDTSVFSVIHNRAATAGVVKDLNAHPFTCNGETGNFVAGVHNGTLSNDWKKDGAFEVDSDWAVSQLTNNGTKALRDFTGAFAFVWHDDAEPGVLNFARNYQRPMYIVYNKTKTRMFFASEWRYAWIADRNEVDLSDEIIELSPGYRYRFDLKDPTLFRKEYFYAAASTAAVATQPRKSAKEYMIERVAALFAQAPAPITSLVPVAPDVPSKTAQAEGSRYVSKDEFNLAKNNKMHGESLLFFIENYDPATKEVWGVVNDKFGDCAAVIRRVDRELYDNWVNSEGLETKVVGMVEQKVEGHPDETVYIMSRKCVVIGKDTDDDVPLATAIKRSIEKFNEDKKNAAADTLH